MVLVRCDIGNGLSVANRHAQCTHPVGQQPLDVLLSQRESVRMACREVTDVEARDGESRHLGHLARGEESPGQKPYYVTPTFIWHKGRMFNRFNRTFVNSAQRFNEVPRLTPLQIEALDAVAELCKDPTFRLDMKLERGDMQFVNNYCVLHSRTAYEDHQDERRKRHLLRLWLRTPAFEDFPSALRDRYQDMDKWRASPRAPSYNFITMKEVTTH